MEYGVYVRVNASGYITDINSTAFLIDLSGWTKIDSGNGDKYFHAQGNYLSRPIITVGGAYRYKLVNGTPVECTAEEIAAQEEARRPAPVEPEGNVWDELDAAYQEGVDSV